MASAAASRRVIFLARFYDVSARVCTISSTLVDSRNYENETWCRRWWHNSQRNISTTARSFEPNLSAILMKHMHETRSSSKGTKSSTTSEKTSRPTVEEPAGVTVEYQQGLPKITVPLQSRKERCVFTLKPISNTIEDFLAMLRKEDPGIDRVVVTTIDDIRIARSNTIEHLLQADFKLIVNDIVYTVQPPMHYGYAMEETKQLSHVQELTVQLYEAFHVREYHTEMERYILHELETIKRELEPYEMKLKELEDAAIRRANINSWIWLVLMSMQVGVFARLTWWEYSWDIMEPITYFFTYGTAVGWFIYFLLTEEEYFVQQAVNRKRLKELHKRARDIGLNVEEYNRLKNRAYEFENALKLIRGPLYEVKMEMQRKKQLRDSRSWSSSSSSRSPSSSPSPSPSPSPERNLPTRVVHVKGKDDTFS